MRIPLALALGALAASAQQRPPFTLDQVLSAPFPTDLTAAPSGGKVAWVSNLRGHRSIMEAAPGQETRTLVEYPDDGQEISELRWSPDASAVVYSLGSEGRGGSANPSHKQFGTEQDVWSVPAAGGAPVKLGTGGEPEISPHGDRVAFISHGQLWLARRTAGEAATQALKLRGGVSHPRWSPDGARIAFEIGRGDHSLIGVVEVASGAMTYLDPSTDYDSSPVWSPDSRRVAFLRMPSDGLRPIRKPERAGEPWSIRVAGVETGVGRQVWRAKPGQGSVFRGVSARDQLLWATGDRIVFPWEGDGWTHLYSVAVTGGVAIPLTPGAFEVEHVAPMPGDREVVFSSNQGDVDRRHLWRVAVGGGTPAAVTKGEGIEVSPAPLSDGTVAWLASDARRPLHPVVGRDLFAAGEFPLTHMVAPQQVVFASTDGMQIHGQLFLPPGRSGARSPAMVFFHGGSRRQMLLGWHYMYYYSNAYAMNQFLANSGYVVLSVNYRSGIGYGLDFREALKYGPAGGSEYNDVQGAGAYLRSRADVDGARIGAWGGSYGGYLTAMALARGSDVFKAGVDFHGVHDWAKELGIPPGEPDYKLAFESSPMNFVNGWRSPVLLIAGDDDPDVQFNQTVMLADALRKRGVDMRELIIPDEGHDFWMWSTWLKTYQATAAFLGEKLK